MNYLYFIISFLTAFVIGIGVSRRFERIRDKEKRWDIGGMRFKNGGNKRLLFQEAWNSGYDYAVGNSLYKKAVEELTWLRENCCDLRCEVIRGIDDSDVHWVVYSHHMQEPFERVEGLGDTPSAAICDAMLPKDDKRRRGYVPDHLFSVTQEPK